jgi:hypothetical protein
MQKYNEINSDDFSSARPSEITVPPITSAAVPGNGEIGIMLDPIVTLLK